MKGWRIAVVCLSLLTLPVLLESCCGGFGNGSCPCNPGWPTNFSITGFKLKVLTRIGVKYDTLSPSPGPLKRHAFSFFIEANYRTARVETPHTTMAAWACSPETPVSDQKISELTITSRSVFSTIDKTIPAGNNLADIFIVSSQQPFGPIDDIIDEELTANEFILSSEKEVDKQQTHQLTILIKLDDGRVFELVTEDLTFTTD